MNVSNNDLDVRTFYRTRREFARRVSSLTIAGERNRLMCGKRARSEKFFRFFHAMMIYIPHLVDRLSHFVEGARFHWTLQSKSSFHTYCSSENSAAKLKKLLHSTCPCSRIHASCISNGGARAKIKKRQQEPSSLPGSLSMDRNSRPRIAADNMLLPSLRLCRYLYNAKQNQKSMGCFKSLLSAARFSCLWIDIRSAKSLVGLQTNTGFHGK